MKFLVSGGGQRTNAVWKGEWSHYEKAIVAEVDWVQKTCKRVIEYTSPQEVLASQDANIVFKAGSFYGDKLLLCTQTEVLEYQYPSLRLSNYLSLSAFNDLHHALALDDELYVVSTGLDMVIKTSFSSNDHEFIPVLNEDPWSRFEQAKDYRKVLTTKPHHAHPNYCFEIDGEIWVTRFKQKDAICLADRSKRMDIGLESVHDGLVVGDYVYFTTVNGMVCVMNKNTYQREAVYDLNEAYETTQPLGWCRSLYVSDERFFVGFSALRSTKLRENLAWVKRGFKGTPSKERAMPTRIIEYDPNNKQIIDELSLESIGMSAVFSIMDV